MILAWVRRFNKFEHKYLLIFMLRYTLHSQ